MTSPHLSDRRAVLLLTALVALLYAPSLGFDFVYDDTTVILENSRLREMSGLWRFWTEDLWAFNGFGSRTSFYRPLQGMWLWSMWQLFGEHATGWHFVSVLLHVAGSVLTFFLGRRLGIGTFGALTGAAVFGVHPLAIQCVAFVSDIDVLVNCVLLGGCLLWIRGGRSILLALGFLFASLLLVERAFAFVGVLGLLAVLRPQDPDGARSRIDVREIGRAALLLLIPVALVLALRGLAGVPLRAGGGGPGHLESLWTAPVLLTVYLQNAVWPASLSLAYPVELAAGPVLSSFVLPLLAIGVGLALAWRRPRRLFLLGAAAGLMVLPLNAALLGPGEIVADRYTYGPLLFVGLFVGDVLDQLARSRGRGGAAALAALLLLPLLVLHPRNLWTWEDNLALYGRAEAVVPGHPKFAMNLSNERRRRGLGDPGCELARSAYDTVRAGTIGGDEVLAAYNLGNCFREEGDLETATSMFLLAAEQSDGVFYTARHNLVVTLMELGRLDEAGAEAGLLIQEAPGWPEAWRTRAITNVRLGRIEQAMNCYRKLLELAPGDADAQHKLALLRSRSTP